MAARKAVYFVVRSGVEVADAIGTASCLVGPVRLRSEAMKAASEMLEPNDGGTYDVVKAHFDVVDTFTVTPAVVAAFVRS